MTALWKDVRPCNLCGRMPVANGSMIRDDDDLCCEHGEYSDLSNPHREAECFGTGYLPGDEAVAAWNEEFGAEP